MSGTTAGVSFCNCVVMGRIYRGLNIGWSVGQSVRLSLKYLQKVLKERLCESIDMRLVFEPNPDPKKSPVWPPKSPKELQNYIKIKGKTRLTTVFK